MQPSPDYLFHWDLLGQNLWKIHAFLETLKFNSKLDLHGLGDIMKIKHSMNNAENPKAGRQTYYKMW